MEPTGKAISSFPVDVKSKFRRIRKRDGRIVTFEKPRIVTAISKAMQASGEGDLSSDPFRVGNAVVVELNRRYADTHVPQIEEVQDLVEETLILADLPKTAKAYILYRHERARIRERAKDVPGPVRDLVVRSKRCFRNELAEFIYYRTYSRWIDEEGRRETWIETVNRYVDFMHENLGARLAAHEYERIRSSILEQRVMPSMRLLWSAGKAARATHAATYNCAFLAPSRIEDLPELMYLLMCGTGVGFSVESQNIQQLPIVLRQRSGSGGRTGSRERHVIGDSKEGWCEALKLGLAAWYEGRDIEFDYSQLRPAGARLRTMGGRSSGPGPLRALLDFTRERFLATQGRRLSNIDAHDIICKIGETIVMGGVRRSALLSLSDFDDEQMRNAKTGHFYVNHPERAMANNSAVYNSRPDATEFLEEWLALARGNTGERGIFNRGSLKEQLPSRRWPGFEPDWATSGMNPCGEIILKSKQFCNLSEVVAREDDGAESLEEKTRIAATIGTYQSMLTHFPYLSDDWRRNCEEERLLGVSITGQWDSPAVRDPRLLGKLKGIAIETNRRCAERFGINGSAAVTCVKPSGTVSQLVDSSSGMHPRYAKYYLRRVRISAMDPLFAMLREQKFPCYPEVGQLEGQASIYVLEFPVRAPRDAVTRRDLSARDQLEYWKALKQEYTEHNPSVTVMVRPDEWIETADWLYKHWDLLGGLSFLPLADSVYQLAPYEEISEEEYERRVTALPKVDFSRIILYEKEDRTAGARALACVGNVCELDPEEGSLPVGPRG